MTFSVDPYDVWSRLGRAPLWHFGDGTTARGRKVTHVYLHGGTYSVRVSEADALGNVSTARRSTRIRR